MKNSLQKITNSVLILFVVLSIAQPLIRAIYHLVNPDVAYHYLMGKYITMGQKPYIDFIDMNFPTIWYLSTIPSYTSSLWGGDVWVIVLFFLFITMGCCYLLNKVLSFITEITPFQKTLFVSFCLFSLTAFQQNEFGQREHLFVVGYLPLLLLKAYENDIYKQLGKTFVFIIGFIGSYISWMKPHYVILFSLIEFFFIFKNRRLPKGLLLAGQITGICIGALPFLFYLQEYLTVAHLAASTYTSQTIDPNEVAFTSILMQRGSWFVYLAVILFIAVIKQHKLRFLNSALLFTAILTWFVAIAQNKAYPYHIKPASTFAIISIIISLFRLFESYTWFTAKRQYIMSLTIITLLCVRTLIVSLPPKDIESTAPATAMTLRTVALLNKDNHAQTVYKLASSAQPLYPGIIVSKCTDITGINSFWYLGSFYRNLNRPEQNNNKFPYHKPATMPKVEKKMFRKTIDDLLTKLPDILIIDNLRNPAFFDKSAEGFNFYDYYSQDSKFREFMFDYALTDSVDGYKWYRRIKN